MIALALAVILAVVAVVGGVTTLVGLLLLPMVALSALVDSARSFHRGRVRRRGR